MVASASGIILEASDNGVNFIILQGKTILFALIWGAYEPINVTGWTARMQFRTEPNSPNIISSWTTENGRISVGGANGKFTFNMSAADSAALPECTGYYDIELIDTLGTVFQGQSGRYDIVREITR